MSTPPATDLRVTPLHDVHVRRAARMAPFAGWEMPLAYPAGTLAEHHHTRSAASLFDVSHMAQVEVPLDAGADLERLLPSSVTTLPVGRSRYTVLTTPTGGVIDDLIVSRHEGHYGLVCNAARAGTDVAHLRAHLGDGVVVHDDLALLALQGPTAVAVLEELGLDVAHTRAMDHRAGALAGIQVRWGRSGYTGEDGAELSVAADRAEELAELLLADERVQPAGLGARDTLRLEAGLCLYGADLHEDTTPVEAGLGWIVDRRAREHGGFVGAEVILRQLADGPARHRVGLQVHGRRPVRPPALLRTTAGEGAGAVTSGTFAPTIGAPVAMGYVATGVHHPGTPLVAEVRGRPVRCEVVALPFVAHRTLR